jgi:hypothetical protein
VRHLLNLIARRLPRLRGSYWPWLIVVAAYVAINAAISFFAVDGAALKFGADVTSWYEPTRSLLKYGAFVDFSDPSKPYTYRQPGYPTVAAAVLWIANGNIAAVVLLQIVLLFGTGLIAYRITEQWLPGWGLFVLICVIFNPSALGTAHLFQSDTVYAFAFALLLWATVRFADTLSWRDACATGVAFGLSLLVRNTLQLLLPLWPVALVLVAAIRRHLRWRHVVMGLAAASIAFVITVPWLLHMRAAGEGFQLSPNYHRWLYLWNNVGRLDQCASGTGYPETAPRTNRMLAQQKAERPDFEQLPSVDQYDYLFRQALTQFLSYSPKTYVCAVGRSAVRLYAEAGVSNLVAMFDLMDQSALSVLRYEHYADYFHMASIPTLLLTAIGFLFVIPLRIFGFIGLFEMLRRRQIMQFAITVSALVYFVGMHLSATSRYRLPVEPLLFILAAYGLSALGRFLKFRPTSPTHALS